MTEITIISGFLGAGKTTLIKKLLEEAFQGEKIVLIENEFGEIGIDGGFLKDAGIQVNEMNSGCICCSLVGDFGTALKEVLDTYAPDRILIEPSGVGKLSDVVKAVENVAGSMDVRIDSAIVVVDGKKCKMYMKNFGEFFNNQVEHAGTIVLSRTQSMTEEKLQETAALLREHNPKATMITTPWDDLDGKQILDAMHHAELDMTDTHEHHAHDHEEHEHDAGEDDARRANGQRRRALGREGLYRPRRAPAHSCREDAERAFERIFGNSHEPSPLDAATAAGLHAAHGMRDVRQQLPYKLAPVFDGEESLFRKRPYLEGLGTLRQSRAEARKPLRALRGLGLFRRDEVEHADAVLLLLVDVEVVRQLDAAHERSPAAEF